MKRLLPLFVLLFLCLLTSCIPGVTTKVVTVKNSTGGSLIVAADAIGQSFKTKLADGETKTFNISIFSLVSRDDFHVYGKNKVIENLDISDGNEFYFEIKPNRAWLELRNRTGKDLSTCNVFLVKGLISGDMVGRGLCLEEIPDDYDGISKKDSLLSRDCTFYIPVDYPVDCFGKEAKAHFQVVGSLGSSRSSSFTIPQPGEQIRIDLN